MAPPTIPGVNIPMVTGPFALGYMWSYMLYGVLLVQMYIYYIHFAKDRKAIKTFVWILFLMETVFTVLTTIAAWNQFGPGWGDPEGLLIFDWSWEPLPSFNGTVAAMVQSFYVWRIYSLTRNIWICILIEAVALMQASMTFIFEIKVALKGHHVTDLFGQSAEITAWLAGSAACDILITITIVAVLHRANRRTKFRQTTNRVTRIIRFTVETGMITSVMAVVELILWLTMEHYSLHFIGFLVLGRLYSNSLVATLNSRAPIWGDPSTYISASSTIPQTTSAFWDDSSSKKDRNQSSTFQSGVRVAQVKESHGDHEMVVVNNFNSMSNNSGIMAGDGNMKYGSSL